MLYSWSLEALIFSWSCFVVYKHPTKCTKCTNVCAYFVTHRFQPVRHPVEDDDVGWDGMFLGRPGRNDPPRTDGYAATTILTRHERRGRLVSAPCPCRTAVLSNAPETVFVLCARAWCGRSCPQKTKCKEVHRNWKCSSSLFFELKPL